VTLARFHRVQGLVWNALAENRDRLPNDAAEALSSDARTIAATNLTIARTCAGLRDAFRESDVPLLFLKGLTVAALAYRSPMLKMGWDIDVLIDPSDLQRAARLLSGCGFSLRLPAELADLRSWHSTSKESVWRHPDGIHVELHTRLADNEALIPSLNVHSPTQPVEVSARVTLHTLAADQLFAYLCVHGASSLWFRLKWITDLAALIFGQSPAEIERLYRRSQQLGAGRAANQALLLSDALYGSLAGNPELREELNRDRIGRWLFNSAMKTVTRQSDPLEPTSRRLGTMPIHLTQLGVLPGWKFKTSELVRQVRSALS
jgi:hypothetical protein